MANTNRSVEYPHQIIGCMEILLAKYAQECARDQRHVAQMLENWLTAIAMHVHTKLSRVSNKKFKVRNLIVCPLDFINIMFDVIEQMI